MLQRNWLAFILAFIPPLIADRGLFATSREIGWEDSNF
jgi:hypothetical protein